MKNDQPDANGFGQEIYGPGKTFFDDVVVDNLFESFLELTATVWMYHDRTIVLERVLQKLIAENAKVDLHDMIEQYQPSKEENARRKQERDEMVNRVFESFARRPK